MGLPEVEKPCTQSEQRRQSDISTDDSPPSSPVTPITVNRQFDTANSLFDPITPAPSRQQSHISQKLTRLTTQGTTTTSDPVYEVDWEVDDPENPRNWPVWYKGVVLFSISFSTFVVVLYSTSYTSTIPAMMEEFNLESKTTGILGLTTYLIGLAVGSAVLAPISEMYGRKPVYMVTLFFFTVLTIPCATAKDITTIIVIRFFVALFGSSLICNAPGTIGDFISENFRAAAFSIFATAPMNGPVLGPVEGSWVVELLSWRWVTWIVTILGGVSFLMMILIKETYAPVLLQKRAAYLRKTTGENRYWSRYDVRVDFWQLMKVNLSRPFSMAVKEPICIFWNLYIGVIYAELYLSFASYPIIFHEIRQWSLGLSSLAFCGIGVGIMLTICLASPIKKLIDSHKPGPDGRIPPESMMSVVCIAAIMVPVGQLWFAWTCLPASIHPAISIAAGIPFGAGNAVIFIYATNYLVGSYGIYAASALAGNSVIRSVLGGVLPLAGPPLYAAMGANWAGTFLGLLEAILIPVPFVFYRYGYRIREKSTLIREMREIEEKQEAKKKKAVEKAARKMNAKETEAFGSSSTTQAEKSLTNREQVVSITSLDIEKEAEAELSRNQGLLDSEELRMARLV